MGLRIGEMLVQKKLITWEQLQSALEEQKKTGELTGEILMRKGFVPRLLFFKTLAEQAQLRLIDLKRTRLNPEAIGRVPLDFATKHQVMPVEYREGSLVVAVPSPIHYWPQENLMTEASDVREIRVVLSLPEDIQAAITEHEELFIHE